MTIGNRENPRFGLGMNHDRAKIWQWRGRLLFLALLARAPLTQLGAASAYRGVGCCLNLDTPEERTPSLSWLGCHGPHAFETIKPDRHCLLLIALG